MHTQQTQHEQLSKQMEDFITTQRQQVEDVTNYQVQAEGRLSAIKVEVEILKQPHQIDVKCLESRQSSTKN